MKHQTFNDPAEAISVRANFYVYVLFRADTGTPFYVGYGSRGRWRDHERRARAGAVGWRHSLIRKMHALGLDIPTIKLHQNLTETTAKAYEKALIRAIGRADLGLGPLVNLTDGGEGDPGRIVSQETCAKIGATVRGRKHPTAGAKISAANRGQKRSPQFCAAMRARTVPQEVREKIAKGHIGKKLSPQTRSLLREANLGKKHSPSALAKMSAFQLGRKKSPEHRAKIGAANLGRKLSAESLAKMSATKRDKPLSPEMRAKVSAAAAAFNRSPEYRAKLAAAQRGRKHSSETRAKMRESALLREAAKRAVPQPTLA